MNRWATPPLLALLGAIAIAAPAPRPLLAQTVPDTTSQARTVAKVAPTPIPAAEIAARADHARAQLRAIEARTISLPAVAKVDSMFALQKESADFQNAQTASQHMADLSLNQIADLALDWQRVANRLSAWGSTLEVEAKRLERDLATLAALRGQWRVTLDGAPQEELPPAALEMAHGVLADIERTQRNVRNTLNHLLATQNRIAEESATAKETLQLLAGATQAAQRRMLHRDSPPLWRIWATEPDAFPYMSDPAQHLERIRSYIANNGGRSGGQLLLLPLVLLALVGIQRQTRRGDLGLSEGQAPTPRGSHVLEHPVSSALLLTFIVTALIHPIAPQGLRTLGTLLAIIPLLRLAPGVLPRGLGRAAYALLLLYLLANLVGILVHQPILRRLGFLAINTLAAGAIAYSLRSGSPARRAEGRLWRAALAVLKGALVILAVALAANTFGFVFFSIWLTYNTLRVIFAGLALLVAAATVDGLIYLVLRTQAAQKSRAIRLNVDAITHRALEMVNLTAGLVWVATLLDRFSLLGPVWAGLRGILTRPLRIGSIAVAPGDVLLFFLILWLSFAVSRIIRQLLRDDILSRVNLPRGVPDTISQIAYYAVVAMGFLLAIAAAGIDMSRFAILAGAFGVGIGFGLQTIVNNFISGLILLFERPIQAGDTVELDNLIGTVRDIGIRASRVRTFDGADVIVPNADLISGRVVNWTLSDKLRRVEVKVGVAYGTDPTRVKELLSSVAAAHPDVLATPPAVALFTGFGDSSLDFVLRFWTADFENWLIVGSDVATAVHDAIREAGIEIPFPQRDLHLRTVAPEARSAFGTQPGPEAK